MSPSPQRKSRPAQRRARSCASNLETDAPALPSWSVVLPPSAPRRSAVPCSGPSFVYRAAGRTGCGGEAVADAPTDGARGVVCRTRNARPARISLCGRAASRTLCPSIPQIVPKGPARCLNVGAGRTSGRATYAAANWTLHPAGISTASPLAFPRSASSVKRRGTDEVSGAQGDASTCTGVHVMRADGCCRRSNQKTL